MYRIEGGLPPPSSADWTFRVPWAAGAEALALAGPDADRATWLAMQATIAVDSTIPRLVLGPGSAAAALAGIAAGLYWQRWTIIGNEGLRLPIRLPGTIGAVCAGAAFMAGEATAWHGLGPRLAACLQPAAGLSLAALAAAGAAQPAPDGRRARTGRRAGASAAACPVALGAGYLAAAVVVHLNPLTSPTPINSGSFGSVSDPTAWIAAVTGAAASTAAAAVIVSRADRRARLGR